MGNALAREAPPALQRPLSLAMRARLEVALAGLDGSGKSTLARALDIDSGQRPAAPPGPTIGVVVQRCVHSGIDLSVWDLGGQQRFRFDWSRHVLGCAALIFVIDISDRQRLPEARQALHQLLDNNLRGMPLLVVVSKYETLSEMERREMERLRWVPLASLLNLDCVTEHTWSICGVSSTQRLNFRSLSRWIVLQAHSGHPWSHEDGSARRVHHKGPWQLHRSYDLLIRWFRKRNLADTEFTLLGGLGAGAGSSV